MIRLLCLFISLTFFYHSSYAAKTEVPNKTKNIEQKINKQADLIRKLKRKNLILKKQAHPSHKAKAQKENRARSSKFSDKALYLAFKKNYEKGNKKNYRKAFRLLAKNYPDSSYFANIYYLAGRSALSKKKYKTALRAFNKVLKTHPNSKLAASAYYSKAFVYQKMNLKDQASRMYQRIAKKMPNSSIAYRSNLQLKRMKN